MNKSLSISQLLLALKSKISGEAEAPVNRLKQIELRVGGKDVDAEQKRLLLQEEARRQSVTTRERAIPSWVVNRDNFQSKPMPGHRAMPGNASGFSIDPLLELE